MGKEAKCDTINDDVNEVQVGTLGKWAILGQMKEW